MRTTSEIGNIGRGAGGKAHIREAAGEAPHTSDTVNQVLLSTKPELAIVGKEER